MRRSMSLRTGCATRHDTVLDSMLYAPFLRSGLQGAMLHPLTDPTHVTCAACGFGSSTPRTHFSPKWNDNSKAHCTAEPHANSMLPATRERSRQYPSGTSRRKTAWRSTAPWVSPLEIGSAGLSLLLTHSKCPNQPKDEIKHQKNASK